MRRLGTFGLAVTAAVWALSIVALGLSMRLNLAAANAEHLLRRHGASPEVTHLHAGAVWFALGCTLLQIAAGLLTAFTLRAAYRLRTATCYALAIVLVMIADIFALFGLLVWMRFHTPL